MSTTQARRLAVMALAFFWSLPVWCQGSIQDQLNSVYKDKTLLLRNFYSGNDLHYDENGALIGSAASGSWTLANIQIKNITVTSQGLEIAGRRLGRLYKGAGQGLREIGKLRIYLALPGVEVAKKAELDMFLGKIFVTSEEDLRSLLPNCWRYYLTGLDRASRLSAWEAAHGKDAEKPAKLPGEQITPPKPLSTPDPKYTKEAMSERIEGITVLRMVIDATGTPQSIAILDPLGMGLDEEAVDAVGHWKFAPSVLQGQPVPAPMNVEISFRCCPWWPPPKR